MTLWWGEKVVERNPIHHDGCIDRAVRDRESSLLDSLPFHSEDCTIHHACIPLPVDTRTPTTDYVTSCTLCYSLWWCFFLWWVEWLMVRWLMMGCEVSDDIFGKSFAVHFYIQTTLQRCYFIVLSQIHWLFGHSYKWTYIQSLWISFTRSKLRKVRRLGRSLHLLLDMFMWHRAHIFNLIHKAT